MKLLVITMLLFINLFLENIEKCKAEEQASLSGLDSANPNSFRRPNDIPYPKDDSYSAEKAELGFMLFFDPRLSISNNISCSSCHNPSLAWGDGLSKGIGHSASHLDRRTPTIANLAWADLLMWDGRFASLEEQASGPIETPEEMGQPMDGLLDKLRAIPAYQARFRAVFPTEGVSRSSLAKALATYERTLISRDAPFDRWVAGDESAVSASAKRGFALFTGRAGCSACHQGWALTDNAFHDIGLPDADPGRGRRLPLPSMQHAFKTPTLRDVALRAPYMHDGSLKTLREVVLHYAGNFVQRPSLAPEIKPLALSEADIADLLDLMETFTGDPAPVQLPILPASPH